MHTLNERKEKKETKNNSNFFLTDCGHNVILRMYKMRTQTERRKKSVTEDGAKADGQSERYNGESKT